MNMPQAALLEQRVREEISTAKGERVLVAMSGGVDSCTLAWLLADELGRGNVLAVTMDAESNAREELEAALGFASEHGVPHRVVEHSELDDPEYVANQPDRCYHCRDGLTDALEGIATEEGFDRVAMGYLEASEEGHAPGRVAAEQSGAWFPWAEASVDKQGVRRIAESLGLDVAERASNACLSSRIPYGSEVTGEKLRQVEEAERVVRKITGVDQVRVRHHGDVARIEVPPRERGRVLKEEGTVTRALKEIGFTWVSLDLAGYRRGSMNEAWKDG